MTDTAGPSAPTQSPAKAWTMLLLAAALEIVFALATGASKSFSVLWPSVIFGDSLSLPEIGCFVLIIGGVVGLQQSDRKPKATDAPVDADPVTVAVRCGGTVAGRVAGA